MSALVLSLPLAKPLPSAANLREHWARKAARVKTQRTYIGILLRQHERTLRGMGFPGLSGRMRVTMVRVAPRRLDDDNLASAFKAVRDEVAKFFGVDDGSPRWEWRYLQQRGEAAIDLGFDLVPMTSDVEVDASDWERPPRREVATDFGPPSEFAGPDSKAWKDWTKRRAKSNTRGAP